MKGCNYIQKSLFSVKQLLVNCSLRISRIPLQLFYLINLFQLFLGNKTNTMKPFILVLTVMLSLFANAQTPVKLVIHHKLGSNPFALGSTATNNLGNTYNLSRMEYYMTKFTIVYNGGQLLPVSDDVVALVNASGESTEIDLGLQNVSNIEGIRFHIGVHTPVNNEDPSLYPLDHPLAPQSPSMHWGWASGYRFIALEGMASPSLNQALELHGLGNENYFETSVLAPATVYPWEQVIHIDADYQRGLEGIDVNSGLIVHGTMAQAATMIANFRDYVYTASQTAAVTEIADNSSLSVYPNPSNGTFSAEFSAKEDGVLTVTDVSGKLISTQTILAGKSQQLLKVEEPGCYFVTLRTGSNTAVQQVVVK